MRTGFVLTTMVIALTLGIAAGASESRLLTRLLIIGFIPAIWAASRLVEWLMGREMWHFSAPYPQRWASEGNETTGVTPNGSGESAGEARKTNRHTTIPLPA